MWKLICATVKMYKINFRLDLKSLMAYPGSFWVALITIPLWTLIQIMFIETVYGQVDTFLGLTRFENYVLFGTYKIVQSIGVTLFMTQLEELTAQIRGTDSWTLDMMLLKPIDSQVFATLGRIWFGSLAAIGVGIVMVIYGLNNLEIIITWWQVVSYILAMCLGIIMLYITYLFIQTWLFWFESLQVGETLWFTIHDAGQYPRNLYRGWLGILFNIVLPITLAAAVPTELLFGRESGWILVMFGFIVLSLLYLTRMFWKFSIKKYSSFSS